VRDSGLLVEDSGPEGGAGPGVGCARFKSIIIYFFCFIFAPNRFLFFGYFLHFFATFKLIKSKEYIFVNFNRPQTSNQLISSTIINQFSRISYFSSLTCAADGNRNRNCNY